MRSPRAFCILLVLVLLLGGGAGCVRTAREEHPPVHVTYTPDPTADPAELIEAMAEASPLPDESRKTERLYENDWITLYRGSRDGRPGLCLETKDWDRLYTKYLELPGTEELSELTISKIQAMPEGQRTEACVFVCYLDADGKERILCADNSYVNYTIVYPVTAETEMELTAEQQQNCGDLLLMGFLYERVQGEKDRLLDPEGWESLCQRRILDALYYNYGDALPPYLAGEGPYGGDQHAAIVSLAELETFFQSAVGRPCLAHLDFDREDRKDFPDLRSDQIVLYPTDYCFEPHVRQAVREKDGTITLYGYVSGFEMMHCGVVCRVRPGEGYLGGQVVSAKIYPAQIMDQPPAATYAP